MIKGVLKPHNKPNTQSTFSKKSVASPITRNFVLSPSSGTILTFPKVSVPRKPLNIAKIKQLSPCQRKRRSDVTLRSFKDVIDTEGLQMDEEVKSEADSYNSLTPPFKWVSKQFVTSSPRFVTSSPRFVTTNLFSDYLSDQQWSSNCKFSYLNSLNSCKGFCSWKNIFEVISNYDK